MVESAERMDIAEHRLVRHVRDADAAGPDVSWRIRDDR
jgi:hypothetical protein